jgi:hypothetical protein
MGRREAAVVTPPIENDLIHHDHHTMSRGLTAFKRRSHTVVSGWSARRQTPQTTDTDLLLLLPSGEGAPARTGSAVAVQPPNPDTGHLRSQAASGRLPFRGLSQMKTLNNGVRRLLAATVSLAVLALPAASYAQEHEFADELTEVARTTLQDITTNPIVLDAIRKQNERSGSYDAAKIEQLDSQWRAEVGAASRPLIEATLDSDASRILKRLQDETGGLITELFVMDGKGLNVAQSTVTSDYWQGDEDKFTLSYGAGPNGINFGEIEQDESTQTFQSQVSIAIVDPESGTPIGAVTAGVDLSKL